MTGRACLLAASLVILTSARPQEEPRPKLPETLERRAVTIWSEGTRMAGDLYLPKGRKPDEKLPTLLLCHGWGGVKANLVAQAARFGQNGFIVLTFDYRGWGESDSKLVMVEKMPKPDEKGEVMVRARAVREVVDPLDEALDIKHALDWLMGEPGVENSRIGLWGTSYGGGLVAWTAAHDRRVKCVVAQVPGMGVRTEAANRSADQRATQQARGEIDPVPQSYDNVTGLRGYANIAKMRDYNAVAVADRVNVPILFIDAENEELFDRRQHGAKAHEIIEARGVPTRYHVVKGIKHYGIYREALEEATTQALEWFKEHLKGK